MESEDENTQQLEEDSADNQTSSSHNNFKLKGPRGLAHKFKKGVQGTLKNARETLFKDIKKKIFLVLLKYVIIVLVVVVVAILVLACFWYIVDTESHATTLDQVEETSESWTDEAREAYENEGSLLYTIDDDLHKTTYTYLDSIGHVSEGLYQLMERPYSDFLEPGQELDYIYEGHVDKNGVKHKGMEIANIYEFMLNSEKLNFNRVNWKIYDRDSESIKQLSSKTIYDCQMVDGEEVCGDLAVDDDREEFSSYLKYPKDYGEDKGKDLSFFQRLVSPYLQSYVIPSAMMSGIVTKGEGYDFQYKYNNDDIARFMFQIIDKGYHIIDVVQYAKKTASRDQTVREYIIEHLDFKKYKYVETQKDANGNDVNRTYYYVDRSEVQDSLNKEKEKLLDMYYNDPTMHTIEELPASAPEYTTEFVYPIVKADTTLCKMRVKYAFIKYNQEDVDNLNKDTAIVSGMTVSEFVNVVYNADGYQFRTIDKDENDKPIDKDLIEDGKITIDIKVGEEITTTYVWKDELEEIENKTEKYDMGDISDFVAAYEGLRPIFTEDELEYYTLIQTDLDREINRIDMLNASSMIYNTYLPEGANYSENIGFSRAYLALSYSLLYDHLIVLPDIGLGSSGSTGSFGSGTGSASASGIGTSGGSTTTWDGISIGNADGLSLIWPIDADNSYITRLFWL